MSELDDHTLVEQWKAGDREAGQALFERHFDSIYGFFSRKLSGDVSDLVQRSFLGLIEGRERFEGKVPLRAYLFGIARNLLYAEYRARQKGRELEFHEVSLHDMGPSATAEIAAKEDSRLLLEALRHIPLELQIAIELHYWEGLRGPEIAVVLGIPEGTVRSRLRRGLEKLRAEVQHLARSEAVLRSTMTDINAWAAKLASDARTL